MALLEQLFVLISFTYFLGGLGPNNALYNVLNHVLHFSRHSRLSLDIMPHCAQALCQILWTAPETALCSPSSAARLPQVLRTDVNPMMGENQSRGEVHAGAGVIPIKCIQSSTFLRPRAKKKERKKSKAQGKKNHPPPASETQNAASPDMHPRFFPAKETNGWG